MTASSMTLRRPMTDTCPYNKALVLHRDEEGESSWKEEEADELVRAVMSSGSGVADLIRRILSLLRRALRASRERECPAEGFVILGVWWGAAYYL